MWGSIGFVVVAPAVGWLSELSGLRVIFVVHALLVVASLAVAQRLPIVVSGRGGSISTQRIGMARGMGSLLKNPAWVLFILTVVMISAGRSAGTFVALRLDAMGASQSYVGVVSAVAAASELPMLLGSGRLLKRWGAWGALGLCIAGSAVDLILLGVMPALWMAIPARMAHGASYALLLVAAVSQADELAPPGLGATSQGIVAAAQTGLGWGLGSLAAGALFDRIGAPKTFLVGAASLGFALVPLMLARVVAQRQRSYLRSTSSK